MGPHFASRVSASLLIAHGVPDLITNSLDEYETLARRLAEEPEALADMRRKARANRQTSSLFDTARFAKSLESAYHRMLETHLSGRKPHHIEVTEDQEEDKPTIRLGASTAEAPPRDPATADSVELLTLANKHPCLSGYHPHPLYVVCTHFPE